MLNKRLMREGKEGLGYLTGTVVLGIGISLLAVGQAWLVARIVSRVFLEGATLTHVKNALIMLGLIIGLRAAFLAVSEITAHEAAIKVKANLRRRFLEQLVQLGPLYIQGERAGELVNSAVEGIESLDDYFVRYIPQLAMAGSIPILILFFVFPSDLTSGIILLLTGPLIPLFMILVGKLAEKKSLKQWQSLSRMSAHFFDMLQGLETLKLFGRSMDQARVIERVSDSFRERTMGVLRVAFLSALVLEFLATISTALVAVTLGLRLVNGTMSFSEALFLLLLAPEFYLPLRTLGLHFHASLTGINAAKRIFEVLDAETEEAPEHPAFFQPPIKLSFENVTLQYKKGTETALNGVSFEVQPGEIVALVGPSGAGKSSVFQILLRFIAPTAGKIEVNGVSLNRIPVAEWREKIAYVSQKPYLFAGTILENIQLGRRDASVEEVEKAARLAFAHDFIMDFPNGYETMIGEGGTRLSGGQVQRIAIARAFLKDAALLLLDEATSGLDVENERAVQKAMKNLLKGRTAILIAHRLNTIAEADHIVVLNQGEIAEQGTHKELMGRQGIYARFIREYRGEAS